MTDSRQLLDDYATTPIRVEYGDTKEHGGTPEEFAPQLVAALRAVLADCDFLDHCIADYKGHEIAGLIRGSITKALEAT